MRTLWSFSFKLNDSDEWHPSSHSHRNLNAAVNEAATFLEENTKFGLEVAVRLVKVMKGTPRG